MKTYKIFSLKLARKLTDRGFKLVGTLPNKDFPYLNVYCFEDSQKFHEALTEITRSNKQ